MNKKIQARLDELEKDIQPIVSSKRISNDDFSYNCTVDDEILKEWCMKVKTLLGLCLDKDSEYYREFVKEESQQVTYLGNCSIFESLKPIFRAFKNDYENGYLTSMRTLITAEVFDSELEQAQELLDNKYYTAAAVIAGVVLETGLRELCDAQTPQISHGKLDKMNAELTKTGVYNKLQMKKITSLADIRNSAAHGKTTEFNHADVQNMIRDIESFLINHLSD